MNGLNRPIRRIFLIALCLGTAFPLSKARAEDFETVSSRASRDYVRKRTPDGTFVPESYSFAKGGFWSGPFVDLTIDKMDFMDIARTIALPLADQNYLPTSDASTTKLLLVVYWGTTFAPEKASESDGYALGQKKAQEEHDSNQNLTDALRAAGLGAPGTAGEPQSTSWVRTAKLINAQDQDAASSALGVMQVENKTRDEADMRNAQMLGYDTEWNELQNSLGGPALDLRKSVMLNELEEDRYFVVVMAYDYQLLVKSKQHKLLWETRFSIREHNHGFNQQLAAMTVQASKFFGQNSNGLARQPLPDGHVDIGQLSNLGVVSQASLKQPTSPIGK